MRIALIDGTKKHTYYPVGLLRIGAMLKDKGHDVKLFYKDIPKEDDDFDEYWISAIFTFEIVHVKKLIRMFAKKGKVRVGGISPTLMQKEYESEPCEIMTGKLWEAEKYPLDYTLLGFDPEYSMAKITDGCIRKCGFCAVHRLEPEYVERPRWKEDILPTTKSVVFSDNNYTARPLEKMREDAEYFKWLVKNTKNRTIDFNQAIDARLITEEMAEVLGSMPISPIRFSYDGPQESGVIQDAITRMANNGKKQFLIYMLYNYTDSIPFAYTRIRELAEVGIKLGVSVSIFPMRYQPLDTVDESRQYLGKKWTVQARKNFMTALNHYSVGGTFSFKTMDELHFWLGKDEDEFVRLMAYPKAPELYAKRKEVLRKMRREEKDENGQRKAEKRD